MNTQTTAKATASPQFDAYGFIHNLDKCVFAYGEHMRSLTIQPPEGGRIGLNIGDKIRASFAEHAALMARSECLADICSNLRRKDKSLPTAGEVRDRIAALVAVAEVAKKIAGGNIMAEKGIVQYSEADVIQAYYQVLREPLANLAALTK